MPEGSRVDQVEHPGRHESLIPGEGFFLPGPELTPVFFKIGAQGDRRGVAGCEFILPGLCPGCGIDVAPWGVWTNDLTAANNVANPLITDAAAQADRQAKQLFLADRDAFTGAHKLQWPHCG